jgi:xanthine dehydrogenase accessory factor
MGATTDERRVLRAAAELVDAGEPFVMITVVSTKGSTPRNAGARMLWRPSERTLPNGAVGTVGGGQFEHLALDAAKACFVKQSHALEHFVLGADADQCCGGTMDVFFEYHGRRARIVIFGAGHVSHALCALLESSAVDVSVVDDREDWISAERFPGARRFRSWEEGVAQVREHAASTLACVLTCSHDTDFEIVRALLERPPAFLGLIGSRSKRACFFSRLTGSGVDESLIQRVRCPIGIGNTGKEPHAVAISIAAQLLMEAKALADA